MNTCIIEGCDNNALAKGLCKRHYQREWKSQQTHTKCSVDGCNNNTRGPLTPYCESHYMRLRRKGTVDKHEPKQRQEHSGGYLLIYAPEHPLTLRHTGNYEYEHRLVYYDVHGDGPFRCHWCNKNINWDDMHVDHVDANVTNNDISNLVASCPQCNQHRGREKMIKTVREKRGRWIEYNGQRKLINEWANDIGITRTALTERLKNGWPLEIALTKAHGKTGPKRSRTVVQ